MQYLFKMQETKKKIKKEPDIYDSCLKNKELH